MKRIFLLFAISFLLAACIAGGVGHTELGFCNTGLCVAVQVQEQVEWGKPLLVDITVTSEVALAGAQVSLTTFPPALVEDAGGWQQEGSRWLVDLSANQPMVFTKQVLLPSADIYEIRANVYHPTKPYIVDVVTVEFAPERIVIDPTPWSSNIAPAVTMSPEEVATLHAVMTQDAVLTATALFPSPLTTPTPHFVSPLPTPVPASP